MPSLMRFLHEPIRRYRRAVGFRKIESRSTFLESGIASALQRVRRADWEPEEIEFFRLIENRRSMLGRSESPIIRRDYGAGTGSSSLSEEAMRAGVLSSSTVGHVSRLVSKSPFWCTTLFSLVRAVRPASCIEMGSAVGLSAAYQAAALQLNNHGVLTTIEGDATLATIAEATLRDLGLAQTEVLVGRFQDVLPGLLEQQKTIDYVFVDGHHDEHATFDYFRLLLPYLARRSVLVFDDIHWSHGMTRAWWRIAQSERVSMAIDLGTMGVCTIGTSRLMPSVIRLPLN